MGAALIRVEKGVKPEIIVSLRRQIPLQSTFDQNRALAIIGGVIKSTLLDIKKLSHEHPHVVSVIIGTPWFLSQSRIINFKSDKSVEYNDKLLAQLIDGEVQSFARDNFPERDIEIVEKEVTQVLLNGYLSPSPKGKKALKIDISIHLSLSERSFLDLVRKELHKAYHLGLVNFHTSLYASLMVAQRAQLIEGGNYIFADIGGELSEVTLIEGGTSISTISVPVGAHSIIRELAITTGSSLIECRSLYQAFLDRRVSDEVAKQVESASIRVIDKWSGYLAVAIDKLSASHIVPSTYVIIGNKQTCQIFCKALTNGEMIKRIPPNMEPKYIICDPSQLENYVNFANNPKSVINKGDIFTIVGAVFIDQISLMR